MKVTLETKFYTWHQNNSGGYYMTDTDMGLGEFVTVLASSERQAQNYFDDVLEFTTLPYCECCGSRFWKEGNDDGANVPTHYFSDSGNWNNHYVHNALTGEFVSYNPNDYPVVEDGNEEN